MPPLPRACLVPYSHLLPLAAAFPPLPLPQTYLLQFPLRPPWRPYVADGDELHNVKLKHKVRLSCCCCCCS